MQKLKVLIPDTESSPALNVIRCLSQVPGIEIDIMANQSNAASRYSRYVKSFARTSDNGPDEYLKHILNHALNKNSDIILPIDEPCHRIFSQNLEMIHKCCCTSPIPQPEAFETVINKWKIAKFCEKNGIPCPKTYRLNGKIISDEFQGISYPAILKPEHGHGGINISVVNSFSELKNFIDSKPDLSMGNYILQEYIPGYDIDMSLLAKDGNILSYTIQKGFIKRSNMFAASAGIMFLSEDRLLQNIVKLISALNYSGIAHIDLRYDERTENFVLIEVNARYWGSLMGSFLAGVNFPYLACLTGLGKKFDVSPFKYIRYVDSIAAIKIMLKHPFPKRTERIRLSETDLKYLLKDPMAEVQSIMLKTQKKRKNIIGKLFKVSQGKKST